MRRILVSKSILRGAVAVVLAIGLFLWSEWASPRVLAGVLSIRPPEEPEATRWLQQYFEEQKHRRLAAPYSDRNYGAAKGCPTNNQTAVARRRTNLVVATVGDGWEPRWLSGPEQANFDLAVVYYGSNPNFTCSVCSDVIHSRGPKWYLYYNLTQSAAWSKMHARGYDYVMLPDDDLKLDTCQISTFFNIMKEFSILLGQPSVCTVEGSYTAWLDLYQQPQYRLHFTNLVEIMAPTFRLDFFQAVVRHTLKGTYTGYGLDFVWPAILGWPRDKVAVVDEVCMVHHPSPPGGKPGGLYDVMKLVTQDSVGDEQERTCHKYNFRPRVIRRHGMRWNETVVFGGILKEGVIPLAPPALEESRAAWQPTQDGGLARGARGALLAAFPAALVVFIWHTHGALRWDTWWLKWRGRVMRGGSHSPLAGSPLARPPLGLSASPQPRPGLGSRASSVARLDAYAQD